MMEVAVIEIVLLAAVLLIAAMLLWVDVLRYLHARRRDHQQEALLHRLQEDIRALCTGALGTGQHLEAMEQKLRRLSERQDQLDMRDPVAQPYGHAIRMAQHGADIEDLMSHCGLPRGEAELLLRLHRVAANAR